jgi:hypothetical protein
MNVIQKISTKLEGKIMGFEKMHLLIAFLILFILYLVIVHKEHFKAVKSHKKTKKTIIDSIVKKFSHATEKVIHSAKKLIKK